MSDIRENAETDRNIATPDNDNSNNYVVKDQNVCDTPSQEEPTSLAQHPSPPSSIASTSSVSSSARVKQSGIKPPSRVGRPCGGIQKPAVPVTPAKNNSDDTFRRVSDDYGRHRLTDLMEADESEEDALDYYLRTSSRRKRYGSPGSTSSMDAWDLHPRRLSEAGLSHHSDSSAVLTEDTDSFIIGQRVWVGGTKPGTIAYIGETQFAPGEWAGIALDEPIGKNDGSVAGIKYFQCENKKGVFSRLTRLTRFPLEQPGMGSSDTFIQTPSPTNNGHRGNSMSPTGSTCSRSLMKSPAGLSTSNTSLTSNATHADFKLGDRVIIKSTQGSKVGMVRFIGLTDFAPGEWVGVELDDPRGKNDGSVGGTRYFECRPNFGLFAPISKVSKSPSKFKPGSCVVHSGSGLPPSGMMMRANSKESMASLASRNSAVSGVRRVRLGVTSLTPKAMPQKSSAPIPARTALQDVLREKQQHIEQLLKERDLERVEITKAASQAEDAEQKLHIVRQAYEQYRAECEHKLRENNALLVQLNAERSDIFSQLEDERRKNEDLLFRFEEAAITQGDIEVTNATNLTRIKDLEKLLAAEREKTEQLEATSNKLFEAEEHLIKAREDVDNLRKELQQARSIRSANEEEHNVSAELIASLRHQLDDLEKDNAAKVTAISKLNEDLSGVSSLHELTKRQVEELHKMSDEAKSECEDKNKDIQSLNKLLEETKQLLQEKSEALVRIEADKAEVLRETNALKMEISAKSLDLETALEDVSAKDNQLKLIGTELETTKSNFSIKLDDFERFKKNAQGIESDLKKEIESTRGELEAKITETEDVKKLCEVRVSEKSLQLNEANATIAREAEEIKQLNEILLEVRGQFEDVTAQYNQLKLVASELDTTKSDFTVKLDEFERFKTTAQEIESDLKKEIESTRDKLKAKIAEVEDVQKLLEVQISEKNLQLEEASAAIAREAEEINHLNEKLVEVKSRFEEENNEVRQRHAREVEAQELQLATISAVVEEKSEEITKLKDTVTKLEEDLCTKNGAIHKLESELDGVKKQMKTNEERCSVLNQEMAQMKMEVSDLNRQLDFAQQRTAEVTQQKQSLDERISMMLASAGDATSQFEALQNEIRQKEAMIETITAQLNEKLQVSERVRMETDLRAQTQTENSLKMQRELEEKIQLMIQSELGLKQSCELALAETSAVRSDLMMKIAQLETIVNEKEAALDKLNEQCSESERLLKEQLATSTAQLNGSLEACQQQIISLTNDSSTLREELSVKSRELIESEAKLTQQKQSLEERINMMLASAGDTTSQFEALQNELRQKEAMIETITSQLNEKLEVSERARMETDLRAQAQTENSLKMHRELEDKLQLMLQSEIGLKQSCELALAETSAARSDLMMKITQLETIVNEKEAALVKLNAQSSESERLLKEQLAASTAELNESLAACQQQIISLTNDSSKLREELSGKSRELIESEAKLSNLLQQCQQKELEIKQEYGENAKKLECEVNERNIRLEQIVADLDLLKNSVLPAKDQRINELVNEVGAAKEVINSLRLQISTSQSANNDFQQTKQVECQNLLVQIGDLTEKLHVMEQQLQSVQTERNDVIVLLNGLSVTQNQKQQYIQRLEEEAAKSGDLNRCQHLVGVLRQVQLATVDQNAQEISALQGQLNILNVGLADRNMQLQAQKARISRLEGELLQIIEDKDLAENQIKFLNSIIVDIQRKNEEQKARIEILESGCSSTMADELQAMTAPRDSKIAPRMYCDICEEFDLHETEDCPQQNNDFQYKASASQPKKDVVERPYCEICEVFGHATEDCQDDGTF